MDDRRFIFRHVSLEAPGAQVPLEPLDARGCRIRSGDRVRVVGQPNLTGMAAGGRAETETLFRHIRGTCRRVRGFDPNGFVEVFLKIREGPLAGWNGVVIEPHLFLHQNGTSEA